MRVRFTDYYFVADNHSPPFPNRIFSYPFDVDFKEVYRVPPRLVISEPDRDLWERAPSPNRQIQAPVNGR